MFASKTNKKSYKRHQYSGPRKSKKKIQAGLTLQGLPTNRAQAWRNEKLEIMEHGELDQTLGCLTRDSAHTTQDSHHLPNLSTPQDTPKIKTYSRGIPKVRYEATACSTSSSAVESVIEPETVDINWPQPDPNDKAYQLTVERTSNDNLSGLSGYRIVDLKHVIKWAFQMEKHHQSCESSVIEYYNEENAVVEIKCFPSLARKSLNIIAASENRKFPLHLENNVLVMNKKHNYYYQVQGQLRITKMSKCYFICFISVTQPLTVIEVDRDENFISTMMPKLVTFFKTCVLPEIVLRRVRKNAKCIDIKELEAQTRASTSASSC